ncbi:hypothetical protein QR680_013399 [Steinernema hermaphroditum]|uniref:Uncharacterized protein n=1 Tax=Steinernema hermaphroditum TaxID=289476 RepID=A0AA39I5D7_9BILA|nr:hypothetical protein QR680_013399 [Steinernema hermaphroditum]
MSPRERWLSFFAVLFLFLVVPFASVYLVVELPESRICYVAQPQPQRITYKRSKQPEATTRPQQKSTSRPPTALDRVSRRLPTKKQPRNVHCVPSHIAKEKESMAPAGHRAEAYLRELACRRRNSLIEYIVTRRRMESFLCEHWIVHQLRHLEEQARKTVFGGLWRKLKKLYTPWRSPHCPDFDQSSLALINRKIDVFRLCEPERSLLDCESITVSRTKRGTDLEVFKCTETIVAELLVVAMTSLAGLAFLCLICLKKRNGSRRVRYVMIPVVEGVKKTRDGEPPTYDSVVKDSYYAKDPRFNF